MNSSPLLIWHVAVVAKPHIRLNETLCSLYSTYPSDYTLYKQTETLNQRLMTLWKTIYNHVGDEDEWYADAFMSLPPKKEYPVYYEMYVRLCMGQGFAGGGR